MNAPITFNTLAFVRRLEAAGMDGRQAEALADALREIVFETTATKADLKELELRLSSDIQALEMRLKSDTRELEVRLMTRLGGAIAASTALTVAILGTLISLH